MQVLQFRRMPQAAAEAPARTGQRLKREYDRSLRVWAHYAFPLPGEVRDSLSSGTMLSLSGTSLASVFLHTKEIVQSVRLGGSPCAVREAERVLRVYGKIATLPCRGCSNSLLTVKTLQIQM
jgi:hypothetical protein